MSDTKDVTRCMENNPGIQIVVLRVLLRQHWAVVVLGRGNKDFMPLTASSGMSASGSDAKFWSGE